MWKGFIKFYFISFAARFLYLTPIATSETICYSRKFLDEVNTIVKVTDCHGTDKICKRFISSEEMSWGDLLNSPCDDTEDFSSPTKESSSEESFQALTCKEVDLPSVDSGSFNCSGYSVGDKCNLICDDGYYSSSSNQTVCDKKDTFTANWTLGNFTCVELTCFEGDLPEIKNGSFSCPSAPFIKDGGMCHLICADGFYPCSSSETMCSAENGEHGGQWFGGPSLCCKIECNQWNEWGGNEYKFTATEQTWENSSLLCSSNDAHLVTIENEEENEFVQTMVFHCKQSKAVSAWIGLNDLQTEGMWEWSDGANQTYRNWGGDQPNDGNFGNCVNIYHTNGVWNDYSCDGNLPTVCERKKT